MLWKENQINETKVSVIHQELGNNNTITIPNPDHLHNCYEKMKTVFYRLYI